MFIIPTICMSTVLLADVLIEDVLPESAIAVVSIENAKSLSKNLEELGMCNAMCEFAELLSSGEGGDESSGIADLYERWLDLAGLEEEDIPDCPSGRVQAGVYPVVDFETGSLQIGVLAIAELGNSEWSSIIDDSISNLVSEMGEIARAEEVELSGASVWMLSTPFDASSLPTPMPMADLERFYVTTHKKHLVIGSDPEGVASAIDAIDGDERKDSLASSELWKELQDRLGERNAVSGSVLLTNLADAVMQLDDSMQAMMFLPIAKSFIGDVDGIAQSARFMDDGIDTKTTVYMGDGRNGMLGLISTDGAAREIPAFVTEDVLSYSQMQIDMDRVVPFLMETISSNPMLAMQLGPQTAEIEKTLGMAFSPLGKEMHVLSLGYLPVDKDSLGYLVAIECKDESKFSDFLAVMMPGLGAEPTDFLGYQIYTTDFGGGMMMPMDLSFSFAVAGGQVFLGSTRPVEQALRSIANPERSKSTRSDNAAVKMISTKDAVGWGYADVAKSMEIQSKITGGLSEDMFADMEAFDPEMAAEMRREFEESQEAEAAMVELLSGLFGQSSWNLHQDSHGFSSQAIMLKPSSE